MSAPDLQPRPAGPRPRPPGLAACLAALALAACGGGEPAAEGGPASRPEHRLLVVGWDGATFDLLDPLLQAGRLPNLARLIERGSSATCVSTVVPISSAAWVSAVTGTTPGQHGVYDFFAPVPGSYGVELVSARSSRMPPLWRILDWQGLSSIVFGVPLTWPPETIDGVVVAGMLAPFDATYAHPPEYTEVLRARGFEPDLGIWREGGELTPQRMTRQLEIKRAALVELLAEDRWDFAMVVFKSLDVLGHLMYDGRTDTAVAQWCGELDRVLGELLDAAGPDTNVIVMSDHGFHAYGATFLPHAWLLEAGYAVAGSGGPEGRASGPLAERRATEHARRVGSLDLERTRVLGGAAEGNFGGLRLNLAGREPRGAVSADKAEALLEELERELRGLRQPGTDDPLVVDVWRADELYPGPYTRGLLPDLLFETVPDVAVRPVSGARWFERLPGEVFPDHARAGIWVAAGPDLVQREGRGQVAVEDLAPTALDLLGLAVHEEMTGRVLSELRRDGRAPRITSGAALADGRRGVFADTSEAGTDDVMERLRSLGYTEGLEGE